MSRFKDFLHEHQSRVQDTSSILDLEGETGFQYRRSSTGTRPGFKTEVGSYVLLRKVKISVKPVARPKKASSEAGDAVKGIFVGVSDNDDVRIDDRFEVESLTYQVLSSDKNNYGIVEILLEKIE